MHDTHDTGPAPITVREAVTVISAIAGIVLLALAGALFAGCAVAPPPVVEPPPVPTPVARVVRTTLWADGRAVTAGTVALLSDDGRTVPCAFDGPRVACVLDPATPAPYGAHLSVAVDGYRATTIHFALTGEANQDVADIGLEALPRLSRLRLAGRHGLVDPQGQPVPWQSVTGFQVVELVAHGREGEAARFLASLGPANSARVLLMAANLFNLSPAEGLAALPATLRLAEQTGRYLELVVLADTGSYPDVDYRAVAVQAAAVCQASPACALLEIGNELWPLHGTQAKALGELGYLLALRDAMRAAAPDVPISLGSTHADQDESDRMRDGDYLTIHGARDDGDEGWRWVRHTNEQRALADRVDRWAINDEPRRDDLDCGRQVGIALLARLFSLGDTFHARAGLFAQPFEGAEAAAFACRARGWAAVPTAWRGRYLNAGFVGSPVRGFSGAVRVYSSVSLTDGDQAYTLVLGATPALRIEWADGWSRERVLEAGGAQLWRVWR